MIRFPYPLPPRLGEMTAAGAANELPGVPVLSTPNDAAEVAAAEFAPTWAAARRATSYDFQSATDSGFATSVVTTNVSALTIDPDLSAGSYYWRVRGRNKHGAGVWSSARSVTLT